MTKVSSSVVNQTNTGSRGSQPAIFDESEYSCVSSSDQIKEIIVIDKNSEDYNSNSASTASGCPWMTEGKTRTTDAVAVTSDESAKVVMAEVERTTRLSRASIDDSESDKAVGGTEASPRVDESEAVAISSAASHSDTHPTDASAAVAPSSVTDTTAASEDGSAAATVSHDHSARAGTGAPSAPATVSQIVAEPTSASMIEDLARAMSPTTTVPAKSHVSATLRDSKCCKLIFSFLPLSQTIAMSQVSKQMQTMVKRYYSTCAVLDLSEFYGVIGSTEFDSKMFYSKFLRSFESVQTLKLRYCTNLKSAHLDRILDAVTPPEPTSSAPSDDESASVTGGVGPGGSTSDGTSVGEPSTTPSIPQTTRGNFKLTKVNLYFCSRLGPRALFKLQKRCPNLRSLNIGRCHAITAKNTINAFKALLALPLESLTFSLDPSIDQNEAEDLLSLLIHEDNFKQLKLLDLSQGCEILCSVDLSDLNDKDITVKLPHRYRSRTAAPSTTTTSSSTTTTTTTTSTAPQSSAPTLTSTATASAPSTSASTSATPALTTSTADPSDSGKKDKSASPAVASSDAAGSSAAATAAVTSAAMSDPSGLGAAAAGSSSSVDTRTHSEDDTGTDSRAAHRSGSDPPSSSVATKTMVDGGPAVGSQDGAG